jgi:RNA polymerase sigma-70 factor (ECF subfamily)
MIEDGDLSEVLARAQRRDPAAVTVLFREYQPPLLRYLRVRVDRAAADDIAGEVWAAVAAGIESFQGDGANFRAWLFTIARNRVNDHHRTNGRRRTDPVAEVPDGLSEAAETVALEGISGQEAVEIMRRHLTDDQLDVVLLRVLGDLDTAQVAALLDRPETWVRVTQHRAMQRLSVRVVPVLGHDGDSV